MCNFKKTFPKSKTLMIVPKIAHFEKTAKILWIA
jgi:hypothetical protein